MTIEFYKYQGTGNDFIIIDDRKNIFNTNDNDLISALCERRFGIGSDGLILLREHDNFDFEMIYFNSDGLQSSMCGNGGRCIVSFAKILGIIGNETTFMAIDGAHKAKIVDDDICLKMKDVKKIEIIGNGVFLDTGSPHYVKLVDNLKSLNVKQEGYRLRNQDIFKKEGVNVNFVMNADELEVRTYERGVETETFSCGTGVVATAIAMHYTNIIKDDSIYIKTRGGMLSVDFEKFNDCYQNIWLTGSANLVYVGEFEC